MTLHGALQTMLQEYAAKNSREMSTQLVYTDGELVGFLTKFLNQQEDQIKFLRSANKRLEKELARLRQIDWVARRHAA